MVSKCAPGGKPFSLPFPSGRSTQPRSRLGLGYPVAPCNDRPFLGPRRTQLGGGGANGGSGELGKAESGIAWPFGVTTTVSLPPEVC